MVLLSEINLLKSILEIVEQKRKEESISYFRRIDADNNEKITLEEFKQAMKEATGEEANEDDVKIVFGENTELDAQQILEKHNDVVRLLKRSRVEEDSSTTVDPPSASELDEETEDVDDDQIEPEESAHEDEGEQDEGTKKPDYSEGTKRLIEGLNRMKTE